MNDYAEHHSYDGDYAEFSQRKPAGPVTDEEAAEVDALTMEERETYWEAVQCGATHNDAMEAADTHGYTR